MAKSIVAHEWRNIPGFPGYQVSSGGAVRSIDRRMCVERRPGWFVWRTYKGRELKCRVGNHGYPYFVAAGMKTVCVHHAVLLAFVGPRPSGMYACHNDGCRQNNNLLNLRWASPRENSADAAMHGTQVRGERSGSARLDCGGVHLIRAMAPFCSSVELGKLLGVHSVTVRDVLHGKTWTHI